MRRLDRYRKVAKKLLDEGKAYHCYASKEELDAMREEQRAKGLKPRYDRRWRPQECEGQDALGRRDAGAALPQSR